MVHIKQTLQDLLYCCSLGQQWSRPLYTCSKSINHNHTYSPIRACIVHSGMQCETSEDCNIETK